jgi:hypothetical protein
MVWLESRRQARRYPIKTSLLFREQGGSEWRQASTLNLSRSGVLFRAEGVIPGPGAAMDFVVVLPLNGLTPPPRARCFGRVVRVASDEFTEGGCAVAVTIDHYTLESRAAE